MSPFRSPKQEAFMFAKHPEIAKKWVGEHGHAKGWSEYRKRKVQPKANSARRRKRADETMSRVTYAQLVNEAVSAMNDGDLEMATELFRAALPLRTAEDTDDGDIVEACTACGKPMGRGKGRLVYTCGGCGTKKACTTCEACFAKSARRCDACGGMFGPSRTAEASTVTAARSRFVPDEENDPGMPRHIVPFERTDLTIPDEAAEDVLGDTEEPENRDRISLIQGLLNRDPRMNDPETAELFIDKIRRMTGLLAHKIDGMWKVEVPPDIRTTEETGGGSLDDLFGRASVYPTAEQIRSAGVLTTKQRKTAPSVFNPGKKVKPDKGRATEEKHFPIPDLAHARNALARVEQLKSVPKWYNGTLEGLKSEVKAKVYRKYPELKKRKREREGD